jgi:Tat protein translocase TatB subunit
MFGLGMMEILMILAIALIVVGPKKLPELAKTLGRAMGEFKRSAQDLKRSMDVESIVKDIDIPKTDLKEIFNPTSTPSKPPAKDSDKIDKEAPLEYSDDSDDQKFDAAEPDLSDTGLNNPDLEKNSPTDNTQTKTNPDTAQ